MKNIVVVSMVKNEEAIIESFVRYSLSFAERIIIFNHNSTDGTEAILTELHSEYSDRIVEYSENIGQAQMQAYITNKMIKMAFNDYNADLVLPLDADEFPITTNGCDVKEFLNSLDDNKKYKTHFMQFSPIEKIDLEKFIPIQFSIRRKPDLKTEKKVIITRNIFKTFSPEIVPGNHEITPRENAESFPEDTELSPDLFYAHYTALTTTLFERKLILGRLAYLMRIDRLPQESIHLTRGVEILKEKGEFPTEVAIQATLVQSLHNREEYENVEEVEEKINPTEIWPAIPIKYTKKYSTWKSNYIELINYAENTAEEVYERKKEIKSLEERINTLENQNEELTKRIKLLNEKNETLRNKNTILRDKNKSLRNSISWKITKPLRKISKLVK